MSQAPIRVAVPPDPRYVRIVRMIAAASAARIGLSVDQLDDLALAIDEACASLLTTGPSTALECSVGSAEGAVSVRVAALDASTAGWPPVDWAETLEGIVLSGATTAAAPTADGGVPAIRFSISA